MNTKMTVDELKAKLDLVPEEHGDSNVLLLQYVNRPRGTLQEPVVNKPDTVFLGRAYYPDDGEITVYPPVDKKEVNAIVIAATY